MELYIFKKLYYCFSIKLQNKMDTNSTCFLPLSSMIHSFTVTDSLVLISLGIPPPRCSQDGNTIGDPVPVWNAIRNRIGGMERLFCVPVLKNPDLEWMGRSGDKKMRNSCLFRQFCRSKTAFGMERPVTVPEMKNRTPPVRSPFRKFRPEQIGTEQGHL